ncbi:MAG: 4-hydroxy-3-methylbut-2-en-1-yl diphosphate synthase [Paludibacter sp.]|nr:4-hydroxy-3-methylbut-2-en-1-yl diphosphate synthase [Paludibacter sp.]
MSWRVNQFNYSRRPSIEIAIGEVKLGGNQPVRVQSMANTDTNNIDGSVDQCIRIAEAGGEIVRFTTQGVREAESLQQIHTALREKGCLTPLVADIHFNANAADVVAKYVEKVRINPGNYVGSIKIGDTSDYTDQEFETEYQKIRARFIPFLNICKEYHTAVRIGVNHGSLSERMMNRYGDTSQGMVESCMEFLRICGEQDFQNVVISLKTSNTVMMVQTVRLLVEEMEKQDMHYPLHLGVTEAGDGEDGRIKSAVGIGALLADGIGDTIRVSLSEEPEAEIPVAMQLVSYINQRIHHPTIRGEESPLLSKFEYLKRKTNTVQNIGGENTPVVFITKDGGFETVPDFLINGNAVKNSLGENSTVYDVDQLFDLLSDTSEMKFLRLHFEQLTYEVLDFLKANSNIVILLNTNHINGVGEQRAFFHALLNAGCEVPVIICRKYNENDLQLLQIKAAADLGVLLIDGFGDGVFIENEGDIPIEAVNSVAFGILQAARVRITKTEFISCPGCGRTMFNLQTVIARIKARTSHLKGLKIGIMGCIVNGPGEMADADYGYVGAGRGKVSLYKKKTCIERNIPEDEAVEKLIELIKAYGDWHE